MPKHNAEQFEFPKGKIDTSPFGGGAGSAPQEGGVTTKTEIFPTADGVGPDINFLARQLGISTDMGILALVEMLTAAQLLDRKHKSYGPQNISKFGITGVVVRCSDKIERLANLMKKGDLTTATPEFDSVEDNLLDIANYGIIGLLCLKGKWK